MPARRALKDGTITATGGRVLNVTARGKTVAQAQASAYAGVNAIDWPQGFCRRDIGYRRLRANSAGEILMKDEGVEKFGGTKDVADTHKFNEKIGRLYGRPC